MTMNKFSEGFSREELLAIGRRKQLTDLPISASEVNRPALAPGALPGFSKEELTAIGERKAPASVLPSATAINQLPIPVKMQSMLQGYTKDELSQIGMKSLRL